MIFIREIRLVNCQSWEDGVIKLSEGLNVIRADNNTGKSVLFKILKHVVCPTMYSDDEVEQLIRWGAEYASPVFYFSDNTLCIVRIYRNRTIYYWTDDATNLKFTTTQDIAPQKLLSHLGMIVEHSENFIANIAEINQRMLLVNSDEKSNYNLIKLLTTHDDLNSIIARSQEKMGYLKTKLIEAEFIKERLINKKESLQYIDITEMEYNINASDNLLSTLKKTLPLYSIVDDLCSSQSSHKDTTKAINACDLLIQLDELALDSIDYNITPINDSLVSIVDMVLGLEELEQSMSSITSNKIDLQENEKLYKACLYIEDLMQVNNHLQDFSKIQEASDKQSMSIGESEMALTMIEGEVFDCPIYGKIKHTDGKCIPINN